MERQTIKKSEIALPYRELLANIIKNLFRIFIIRIYHILDDFTITKILDTISIYEIVRDRRDNKNTAEGNPSAVFGRSGGI